MSLHVNFLRVEERHDPVVGVVRTAMISLGALLVAGCASYVLFAYLGLASARMELARARRRTESLGANVKTAISLEKELADLRERSAELASMSNSAFRASRYLAAVAENVPGKIQLTRLSFGSDLVSEDGKNERFGRHHRGTISGRLDASASDGLVQAMIDAMRAADGKLLGAVTPSGLTADPRDPSRLLFDVRFDFGFRDCGSLKPPAAPAKGGPAR